jgi:hypothetical protein
MAICQVMVITGQRRRGPYATSPPRLPRDLPFLRTLREGGRLS